MPLSQGPSFTEHYEGQTRETVGKWTVNQGASSLVAPGRTIPPQARAVHHLSDEELRTAPQLREAMKNVLIECGAAIKVQRRFVGFPGGDPEPQECAPWLHADVIAAHNMGFDWAFIKDFFAACQIKTLCTWRCAIHVWPDAPGYGNQVLRYYIPGLDAQVRAGCRLISLRTGRSMMRSPRHSSSRRCLLYIPLEALLVVAAQPVLQKTVRFGKHRGVLWSDVPLDYCRWIIRQDSPPFDRDVVHTARYYLSAR